MLAEGRRGHVDVPPYSAGSCCVLMYTCIVLAQSLLECMLISYNEIDVAENDSALESILSW